MRPTRMHAQAALRAARLLRPQTRDLVARQQFTPSRARDGAEGAATHLRRARLSTSAAASSSISSGSSSPDTPSSSTPPSWDIKLLYDGGCPLCMREVDMLRRRDAGRGRIAFVDIDAPDYDPQQHGGVSFEQAMERIHGVLPDGSVVVDVEVFRRCYEAVGLGWVYAITRVPAVERAANQVYNIWAKYRLPITGRPDLAVVLQQKQTRSCRAPPQQAAAAAAAEQPQ